MTNIVISTSQFQAQTADLLPCNKGSKSQLILGLMNAYGLLEHFDNVVKRPFCQPEEITQFHDKNYVDYLMHKHNLETTDENRDGGWEHLVYLVTNYGKNQCFENRMELLRYYHNEIIHIPLGKNTISKKRSRYVANISDDNENDKEMILLHQKEYNLEGDCPLFPYLPLYIKVTTGATLRLLDIPNLNLKPISHKSEHDRRYIGINWDGGRHHAGKRKASGFCYINDIVLLTQKLRKTGFHKITYLDFDLHHGDGVEKATLYSRNIQTISLHLYEVGFFPCTGSLEQSRGYTTVNLPLRHGMDDVFLDKLNDKVIKPCIAKFEPEIIVIQCGSDGLMGDSYQEWQLSIKGLTRNIIGVMENFPESHIILLGGGGYNVTLASRFYTYLTWSVLNSFKSSKKGSNIPNPFQENDGLSVNDKEYDVLIPDHEFSEMYGENEHFKFWIYDQDGSLLHKPLKNQNDDSLIETFRNHYQLNDTN